MNTSLLDRLLALAPLGVLIYALRRGETTHRELLRTLTAEHEQFRNERRELINRLQFPTRMPVASVPIRPDDRGPDGLKPEETARAAWSQLGRAASPVFLPGDNDDAPGAD